MEMFDKVFMALEDAKKVIRDEISDKAPPPRYTRYPTRHCCDIRHRRLGLSAETA